MSREEVLQPYNDKVAEGERKALKLATRLGAVALFGLGILAATGDASTTAGVMIVGGTIATAVSVNEAKTKQ